MVAPTRHTEERWRKSSLGFNVYRAGLIVRYTQEAPKYLLVHSHVFLHDDPEFKPTSPDLIGHRLWPGRLALLSAVVRFWYFRKPHAKYNIGIRWAGLHVTRVNRE